MRIDAALAFVPLGGNLALAAGAGVNQPSGVIDLLGFGVGVAPTNQITGTAAFRADPGVGARKQTIEVNLLDTTAIASANAATLNIALQLAPDPGAAGNYTPAAGDWQTIAETGPMTVAQLEAARTGVKQQAIRMDWPPDFPANLNPRFARLLLQVPANTNFDTGAIAAAFITVARDDLSAKFASKNYAVS